MIPSVWVDYFRGGNRRLARARAAGTLWMHPLSDDLGWIDVCLLASARLAGLPIWTRDRDLAAAGRQVGVKVTHG